MVASFTNRRLEVQSFFDDESLLAPARVEVEHLEEGGLYITLT